MAPGRQFRQRLLFALDLLAAFLFLLIAGCGAPDQPAPGAKPAALHLYCGAGLRPPVAEMAEVFGKQHGMEVECDYAGSEVLLTKLKHTQKGDVYIPGDVDYVDQAAAAGFVCERAEVAYWVPVIMVKKGNPKQIVSLQDLARPGVRVGLGDAKACAIGKRTQALLKKNGVEWAAVEKNQVYSSMTVNELGLQVKLGQVDATVVWDATARYFADETDAVAIPKEQNLISSVPVATLRFSQHPEWAARFLAFVQSAEGRAIFEKHGYSTTRP